MNAFAGVALLVGLAYGGMVAFLYFGQRGLMYFPDPVLGSPAEAGAPEMAEVDLRTADGLRLRSWYAPPRRAGAPVLLYFHGNAGSIAGRASKVRPFLDAGLGVLLAEYRGFGGNPGRPEEAGLQADGRAALAFLEGQAMAPADIVVYGESLGTGIAVNLAHEVARAGRPFAATVLEAPFLSMARAAQAHYPWTPALWLVKDRYDNHARIDGLDCPLLIVHGELDPTVPVGHGQALFAAAREPKRLRLLPAAAHNDLYDHGMAAEVLDFIAGLPVGAAGR